MASNASSSSSSQTVVEGGRPQAGPLPQKRGEIGFRESIHQEEEPSEHADVVLPARHPADRDGEPTVLATTVPPPEVQETSNSNYQTSPPVPPSSTQKKRKHVLLRLQRRIHKTAYGGIVLPTFIRFFFQLAIFGVTIALWVIVIKRLDARESQPTNDTDLVTFGGSGSIFVHVAFGVAVLGQLLFLERCVFLMRAQRYNFLHPNASLPFHSRGALYSHPRQAGMGFAPWNRPPLPTYAATLAQSGFGTGDVEDNAIAIPPPPAYGNTRGSTLLLAGFLRNSLRRDLPAVDEEGRRRSRTDASRPISYVSQDDEWEERCDAERALRLAETLARLEEGSTSPATIHPTTSPQT